MAHHGNMSETEIPGEAIPQGVRIVQARAFLVGDRIEPKAIEIGPRLGTDIPLTVRAGENGCAVLFRYGVVVQFGLTASESQQLREDLKPFVRGPLDSIEANWLQTLQ